MSEQRLNMVTLICGRRTCGKTTFTLETIKQAGYERIIVLMIDDHVAYRHMRTFTDNQLGALKLLTPDKKYQVRLLTQNPLGAFFAIQQTVSNCCVIFEDAANYMDYNLPEKVKNAVISCKQKNNDLIFQFHNLQDIPPRLLKLSDLMSLFRVNDTPETTSKKIPAKVWGYLAEVERDFNAKTNPWPKRTFNLWD